MAASSGFDHSCAVSADGELVCFSGVYGLGFIGFRDWDLGLRV